jgi:tetratricopeptide (TPR) repeat protein
MKIQRQAIAAAAVMAAAFAPKSAVAQRNQQPIPIFVVVTFKSPGEPKLGIEAAEAVRQRMMRFFPQPATRQGSLRIVKQEEINSSLTGSGYPADSAITTTDLRDLSRGMGANESMEGTIKRTAEGVEARARFYVLSNIAAPEVLPVVVEKNAEAAGRKIAEIYQQARKQIPAYEKCKNALIQNQPEQAVAAAREALEIYDEGVLSRACLLTAYQELAKQNKIAADSVVSVANRIIAIDSSNEIAIRQLAETYRTRGDSARAIEYLMRLWALNPMDVQQARGIVDVVTAFGAPEKALTIVEDMKKTNPGDAEILDTQWKLLQYMKQWKQAIAVGEEMVKFDTSKADTAYFSRQIGAAYQDSQPQLALQFLARATQKFPRDVRLLQAYVGELMKQGQTQQALDVAKRVVAVDPKAPQGYATIVVLYTQLNQGDSAVAFAKQALVSADSATKDQIGKGLLTLIGPSLNAAQADTTSPADVQRENWTKVYRMSAAVDSIVPQAQTAFFMSFSAFNLAMNAVNRVQGLAQAKNTAGACTELKNASEMVLIVDLNMARGGRFNAAAAGNILNAVSGTIKPYIESTRSQLKCK